MKVRNAVGVEETWEVAVESPGHSGQLCQSQESPSGLVSQFELRGAYEGAG